MSDVLEILLMIALVALALSATIAAWYAVSTLRATRTLMEHADEQLIPLVERATSTLDSVDREMNRVDGIVTRFEDVSDTVSATTRVATEVVRTPLVKLAGVSGGMRALFSGLRRR